MRRRRLTLVALRGHPRRQSVAPRRPSLGRYFPANRPNVGSRAGTGQARHHAPPPEHLPHGPRITTRGGVPQARA